jgi:hypothetical protein
VATIPSELELVVRREVVARLRIWGIAGAILFLTLCVVIVYLALEIRSLRASAVLLNKPLIIYNPAWETALDAVNPMIFPGTHRDDIRKGTLVQQWPVHGGPQHLWELRMPYGDRYQASNALAAPVEKSSGVRR